MKEILLFILVLPLLCVGRNVSECKQIELYRSLRAAISRCVSDVSSGAKHVRPFFLGSRSGGPPA